MVDIENNEIMDESEDEAIEEFHEHDKIELRDISKIGRAHV